MARERNGHTDPSRCILAHRYIASTVSGNCSMLRLVRYLKPFSFSLVVMLVLLFGQTTANLQLPDYMAKIVNEGIVGQDTRVVYRTGFVMLLVALIGGACMVGVGYLASKIAT